ncbi:MAG TPA: hypothetical protein PKY73_18310 [Hyphomonas sp.]|nr:hypothetical protein [Hyphomonas sp.]
MTEALTNEHLEIITRMTRELDDYLVSLRWGLGAAEEHYGLHGEARDAFLRRYLIELVKAGGQPIEPADDGIHAWRIIQRYGTTPEEIADGMLAEWKAAGEPDPDWGEYSFAAEHVYTQLLEDLK